MVRFGMPWNLARSASTTSICGVPRSLNDGVGRDMRRQLSTACKFLVHGQIPGVIDARQNAAPGHPAHGRIEPSGDPETVQVANRGPAGPEQEVGGERRQSSVKLDLTRVHREAIEV